VISRVCNSEQTRKSGRCTILLHADLRSSILSAPSNHIWAGLLSFTRTIHPLIHGGVLPGHAAALVEKRSLCGFSSVPGTANLRTTSRERKALSGCIAEPSTSLRTIYFCLRCLFDDSTIRSGAISRKNPVVGVMAIFQQLRHHDAVGCHQSEYRTEGRYRAIHLAEWSHVQLPG
jgi:hypothetical protein